MHIHMFIQQILGTVLLLANLARPNFGCGDMILAVHPKSPNVVEFCLANVASEISQLFGHMLIQMLVIFGPPAEYGITVLADENLLVVVVLQMDSNGFYIVCRRRASISAA